MVLSRDLCISEGETLQGKIPWIWVGVWDPNDFNTRFKIKFRTTETPYPLMTICLGMTKPSNTYFAGSTLCVTGIQLPLSGESKSRKQGQFLRHRNTWMWVVMRKILLCIYQLSKTRAPCHHCKIFFLHHLCECVILFSLFSITCKAHGSLMKTEEAPCYFSSPPFHLLPRLAFLPAHPGL